MINLLEVFDRLDAAAKQDILQQEEFQLTAPEGENQDEDSLGELSTNDAIELKEETNDKLCIL